MKNKTIGMNQHRTYGLKLSVFFLACLLSTLFVITTFASQKTLEAPEEAKWSKKNEMKASWEKVEGAKYYQLRLYYNGECTKTLIVDVNKADLSEYMMKEGYYYYEVCALGKKISKNHYESASEYTESESHRIQNLGDIDGKWRVYNEGKKYSRKDGSYIAGQWYRIRGQWYLFDAQGYMLTGWQLDNGKWYYMNPDGTMHAGWLDLEGKRYFLNPDGSMATGWVSAGPSQWYYFYEDGSMAKGVTIDGYSLNSDGIWSK